MKKIICLLMALAICAIAASCIKKDGETTGKESTETTSSSDTLSTSGTDGTSSAEQTGETTTATETTKEPDPIVNPEESDNRMVTEKVGSYVSLIYNPAYCTINASSKKGVGSKETVTLIIEMKEGYIFDGWSLNDAMANGKSRSSGKTEYTFNVGEDITVYANYSVSLIYYPNGGDVSGGTATYTQTYSVVMYKCPNTLPWQGYFSRDGYTLVEYNTKADGTGEAVSLGSRIALGGKPSITLYCIWEKQNAESDFDFTQSDSGASITKYKGSSDNVVIPDYLGGKKVIAIKDGAFAKSSVKRVVLSANVAEAEDGAFSNCKSLVTFVMFDSLKTISGESFTGTTVENLRVNAVLNLYSDWMTGMGNNKVDRVLWAKNMKKLVIYGGSGTYYGYDCAALDEALDGEYVVINLGANAQVTASMYFEFLTKMMNPDDVLLWSPEFGEWTLGLAGFYNGGIGPRTWQFIAGHYDILRCINIANYTDVFSSYAKYAALHTAKQQAFDKFSTSISDYGDNIAPTEHKNATYDYQSSMLRVLPELESGMFDYCGSLVKKLTESGVRVYYTFAAMDESGIDFAEKEVARYMNDITAIYPGIVIISDYKNCLVPNSLMFDSAWHLTLEGASFRTGKLITDLKKQLSIDGAQ